MMHNSTKPGFNAFTALPLKLHPVPSGLLLFKLEHVGMKPEPPQQAVPELFQLAQHLVFLLVLLSGDPGGHL
jgi:hypothetical protein